MIKHASRRPAGPAAVPGPRGARVKAALPAVPPRVARTITAVVLAVVAAFFVWQTLALNALWLALRAGAWLYVTLGVLAVAGLVVAYRTFNRSGPKVLARTGVIVACVCVPAAVILGVGQGYGVDRARLVASVSVAPDGQLAEYASRAPFTVAENQTASHVDFNGNLGETTYVPTEARFGTLIADRGLVSGYHQVVWQSLSGSGQSTSDNCSWATDTLRFDGMFGSNLQRAIIRQAGPELITTSDAYGLCVDGAPKIIVPLKTYAGFIRPYQVPDGVAIIDANWKITIDRDVTPGEYPGPVYPMSLAVQQRAATTALGTWWDHVQNRVGYQPTGDNAETNTTEFNLERADGSGSDFVTPLTLVGQAQSINAVGVVPSGENHAGTLNPYRVIILSPPRQANSAVTDRLHADYGNLQEWAAGMRVYEIVPTGPGTWQATMGMPKAVIYVAKINADGTSCLFSAKDGTKIGCSTDAGTTPGTSVDTTDLAGLTDAELAQLLQRVACEMGRRQGVPGAGC